MNFLRQVSSRLYSPGCLTLQQEVLASKPPSRSFFAYLNQIFNQVDKDRIKEVGPDRACAEWLLKNGAHVKWKSSKTFERNYDKVLTESGGSKIEEIDGDNSSVMSVGFPHLAGIRHLRRVRFRDCKYLDNESLRLLELVKETLEEVELSYCYEITDHGLAHLVNLQNLKKLDLSYLPSVQDREKCLQLLKSGLPHCDVSFPDVP